MRFSGSRLWSDAFFALGLTAFAVGIPTGKFIMSLGSVLLGVAWLLRGDYAIRIKAYLNHPAALIISSLFFLHLIGLLWSHDLDYALKDLRVKLPLFILPFIFSGMPVPDERLINRIMALFIAAICFTTIYNLLVMYGFIGTKKDLSDIRNVSTFISHVRLSMCLALAIVFGVWQWLSIKQTIRWAYFVLITWLLFYIMHTALFAAFVYLTAILVLLLPLAGLRAKKRGLKVAAIVGPIVFVFAGTFLLKSEIETHYTPKENPKDFALETQLGEPYQHHSELTVLENGYYIWSNIAPAEMIAAWNERSNRSVYENDDRGHQIYYTAIRYITSKGLKKDRQGVMALSEEDITNIERGIASVNWSPGSLRSRIHAILFEVDVFRSGGDPSGHSITQRLLYWQAAGYIMKQHPFGVGTGDVPKAFNEAYVDMDSPLKPEARLRAHNQYLTMGVAFGFAGMVLFVLWLLVPYLLLWRKLSIVAAGLLLINALSFVWEDTLETQEGVTLLFSLRCSFCLFLQGDSGLIDNFCLHPDTFLMNAFNQITNVSLIQPKRFGQTGSSGNDFFISRKLQNGDTVFLFVQADFPNNVKSFGKNVNQFIIQFINFASERCNGM
jgi:hypothetical protein